MRIGDIVRLPDRRLALVEQTWPSGVGGKQCTLEVFVPGSTVSGGSFLTVDSATVTRVGHVTVGRGRQKMGRVTREGYVTLGGATTVVEVVVREGVGREERGVGEVRREAIWKVAKGGGR